MENLEIKTNIQIGKPIEEVFEGIVDPAKMSNYFIAYGSARLQSNAVVTWQFPEFPEQFTVKVLEVRAPELISFEWEGAAGQQLTVKMRLEALSPGTTLVTITESSMPNNEAGIKWLKSNTEGWANFSACLKAFLEYNINLRKGAFDFMKKP
ncbi:ATPase [Chitinophaga caeni]|uniref:ATPase n=1 Tax=Chitinophaga caeni TaxID=2029983 RepID=A0A291QXZ1_9BACT|nr:SRPBCC domain-containing protein [Chitinophaga caeni]ATL48733.1 ATPase [Chitinophaga caeni]